MTCRDFVAFLDDYLNGALLEAQVDVFNAHLARCPHCVSYMKSYSAAVRLHQTAAVSDLPDDVPEDLVQAILVASRS